MKPNNMKSGLKLKLKPIPSNTVVHTPTEEEAKELLAILHENGYKWSSDAALTGVSNFHVHNGDTCYCLEPPYVTFRPKNWFIRKGYTILTIAEFKAKYCEEEKPHPKFKVGDKVKIVNDCGCNSYGLIGMVELVEPRQVVVACSRGRLYCAPKWLEPYTEPETKDETMDAKDDAKDDTKDDTKDDAKALNLVELLEGHVGENFFSLAHGDVKLDHVSPTIDSCIVAKKGNGDIERFYRNGRLLRDSIVMLFPSRTLYEKYPLDPLKAWSVWQKEQKKYVLQFSYRTFTAKEINSDTQYPSETAVFRTSADRDKCLSEIKAIIEKYSKL